MKYELYQYDEQTEFKGCVIVVCRSDAAALGRAGRLAKRNGGPVDLARASNTPWHKRYLTTASPSEFHAKGYRFERLT